MTARPMRVGKPLRRQQQRGFTYLLLLFAIALLGIGLTRVATSWQLDSQREKEQDLLFAGRQIRAALHSYVDQTPLGRDPLPRSIDDLLEDHRQEPPRRHLRRRYLEPFSGTADWLPIRSGDYLIGVSSQSELEPLKKQDFEAAEGDFALARRYRDWRFQIDVPPVNDGAIPSPLGNNRSGRRTSR